MKNELIKKFVKKMIRRTFIFVFVMIIVAAIGPAMQTVISNELALAQMEPSNEAYILIDTYYALRPLVNFAFVGLIMWYISSVVRAVYKFVKNLTSENE